MAHHLLATLDRSLTARARDNAASAVRADSRRAAQRQEAVTVLNQHRQPLGLPRLEAR